MSVFSSMIDISSFFIGILINLLLVAMICFYFKRKIDNLEASQSEQAKILFQVLQQNQSPSKPMNNIDDDTKKLNMTIECNDINCNMNHNLQDLDNEDDDDDDESDEEESDEEENEEESDEEDIDETLEEYEDMVIKVMIPIMKKIIYKN